MTDAIQAPPALTPDVQELVAQAQKDGVSIREYIRRTAQSAVDASANKVKAEITQEASAFQERQRSIVEAGEEFDGIVANLVGQGVDLSGKDLTSLRNKHVASKLTPDREPEPILPQEPDSPEQQQDPMMVAANQMLIEAGLTTADAEFEVIRQKWAGGQYPNWNTLFADIGKQSALKNQRVSGSPETAPPVGIIPGEIGGGSAGGGSVNPIANINDPDELFGQVDWDNMNLPKG